MSNNRTIPLLIIILASSWLCIATNVPENKLREGFESMWNFMQVSSKVSISMLLVALFGALCWLVWVAYSRGIIWHSEARIRKAQADGEELRANLVITTAAPGMQVYASETGRLNLTHKPLYLSPGNVNGKEAVISQEQERRWAFFNLTQNISHKPDVTKLGEVTTIQQVLPDHVDLAHYLMGQASLRSVFLGIGKYPDGMVKPVSAPLERLVHIAEAGSSGFGKSTHLQTIGYQCLNAREAPQVVMLDPQAVTFTPFAGNERLKYPIASREADILAILVALVGEMECRQQLFAQWRGVATLGQYNQVVGEAERLPQVPIFFDEFGLVSGNKEIARQVKLLAQGGRKSGISLICGAQTWGSDDIATSLRANLSTSVQFYARDKSTSRILLGDSAAANITRPGQAFCRLPGQPGLVELQAPDPSNLIDVTPLLIDGNGPPMPEVKPDETERQILDLAASGASLNEIARQVYNGIGGKQNQLIKEVLAKHGRE